MNRNMLFVGLLGASVTFAAMSAQGQVVEIKAATDWKNAKAVKELENNEWETTRAGLISKASFKIDPAKTYRISGEFKSTDGPSLVYLGFVPKDAGKVQITPSAVTVATDTQTEVIEAVAATDTQIKIKDGSKWKISPRHRIVLNAEADLSDLPNFAMINVPIKEVAQDGDVYTVTLDKAIGKAIEAGTKVRLHLSGGGYLYTGSTRQVGDDWTTLSGTITGEAKSGWNVKVWPQGADTAEIVILADWNGKNPQTRTQFRNIKVEEVGK